MTLKKTTTPRRIAEEPAPSKLIDIHYTVLTPDVYEVTLLFEGSFPDVRTMTQLELDAVLKSFILS